MSRRVLVTALLGACLGVGAISQTAVAGWGWGRCGGGWAVGYGSFYGGYYQPYHGKYPGYAYPYSGNYRPRNGGGWGGGGSY